MAGSFESGAGDLDEIFESEGEKEEESEVEAETEQEIADTPNIGRKKPDSDDNQGHTSTASPPTDSRDHDQNQKDSIADADTDSERVTVGFESDAARLAHEFVPNSYDKPHAWALGRNGVNDGRQEKKTFFLQEQILGLEEECRSEVNETLEGDVPLTDMRELALIIAYHQPERIAEAAREWGSESV